MLRVVTMASKKTGKATGRDGASLKAATSPTTDETGKTREQKIAALAMDTVTRNAATVHKFSVQHFGATDLLETIDCLRIKTARVCGGNLSEAESILTAQAVALDAIFTELAARAAGNMGQYLNAAETYMRLALKAQSQCRTTLEALAEIKNPRPVAFVRQQNLAVNQQVNNGSQTANEPRAHEKNANPSIELSGATHELPTNAGASPLARTVNPQMETVGAIDRATD